MTIPSPSFLLGLLVLVYFASFILLAVIRITTGLSIQRFGIYSLKRIKYTLGDGIRIEVRSIGFNIHRPTFVQPTWLSLVLSDVQVILDVEALGRHGKTSHKNGLGGQADPSDGAGPSPKPSESQQSGGEYGRAQRSRTWGRLMKTKERIKRLHGRLHYIRWIDVVAANSSCVIRNVGTAEIGSITLAVDTRRSTVDRRRFFLHRKAKSEDKTPAEWIFTMRSVFYTPEGKESTQILDHATLNIHGMLYRELEGLRDASIALNLGRLHIPYDDIKHGVDRVKHFRNSSKGQETDGVNSRFSLQTTRDEAERPRSWEQEIIQTVSDSKEFLSSILRGIQEVQFAINFIGFSKFIRPVQPIGSPVYLNMASKELSVDLIRMDPKSPAHRMYFSPKDVAHQALVAAISITVGIDSGNDCDDKLVYIPMATMTMRTTLPSKTIQLSGDENIYERNTNVLAVNTTITSPSVDLEPKHLHLVLALLERPSRPHSRVPHRRHQLISTLLPKASIKLAVHEPVFRVTLPAADSKKRAEGEFDLLILILANFHMDVNSSHSDSGELGYSVAANMRTASHQLYYQTAVGEKHNLLLTNAVELSVQVVATPEVRAVVSGNFQALQLYLVRSEIRKGLRRIVRELRSGVNTDKKKRPRTFGDPNFLRSLPSWLVEFHLEGSDFSVEIAGLDPNLPQDERGIALQLESWTAEYKAYRTDVIEQRAAKRRSNSLAHLPGEILFSSPSRSSSNREADMTDGRRLAVHTRGLEGFVIEREQKWEPESFVSLPRFELAFTTSSDQKSSIFHVNSHIKSLFVQYSLYRHYVIGIAVTVLRRTFAQASKPLQSTEATEAPEDTVSDDAQSWATQQAEIVTIDVKAGFVQVKATMPDDPLLMLQAYDLYAGRHRWTTPFAGARSVRLHVEAPRTKKVWARLVSVKNPRVDLRELRRRSGQTYAAEKSIDFTSDAIRIAVPHQLVVHNIFDNFANLAKITAQLHHRFLTGTNEYILTKHPEGPKHVPKLSMRVQALLFEIEDGAFEWKLGTIYRVGLVEQKQRLAREEAFRLKVKKMAGAHGHRSSSRFGRHSAHPRRRSSSSGLTENGKRSTGEERRGRRHSSSQADHHGTKIRYDPAGICGLGDSARRSANQAWEKLQHVNAQSWKKRIDIAMTYQNNAISDIRALFWGLDDIADVTNHKERMLAVPQRLALMAVLMSDVEIVIDKPSFPMAELPAFIHRVGKGMPFDTKYSLLIPMNVQINTGEARVSLRDYPLPLLHIPAIRAGQSPRLPSWSLTTDFVIAEEYRDNESSRLVKVMVVPPEKLGPERSGGGFAIDVRRTVSPVKTYSDMQFDINTTYPTKITWGSSYQPAIQDMMQVMEGFSKPQLDPSERVGFWDKIRLNFHSRVNVAWKGDGDVHLILKGSRDPYSVTGTGAGFVMVWRNKVRWNICQDDDPRKFMIVDSDDYMLAIPDFSHYARHTPDRLETDGQSSISSEASWKRSAMFKKVIMKLSGNVRWLAGLVLERDTEDNGRSFSFKPHYEVTFKGPEFAKAQDGLKYDAFRGFRSNYIHMSIAVAAPLNRDWSVTNLKPSSNYNTIHLSPRFFTHFFDWWSMFSGVMALPVRQGRLWPGVEKTKKKFGRHVATLKYNLLLSPLFISHVYKHKEAEDYRDSVVKATGLKLRLDSFMLDLHQRREHFKTEIKGLKKQIETSGMRINECQLDFIGADIRAISANILGTDPKNLERASAEDLADYQQAAHNVDLSRFIIPDNDFAWIDMDDFVELDWIVPAESNPETKILPLAFAPRFTYFRQTDHQGTISGDPNRHSPFGKEPTHFCVMSTQNDPRRVQSDLISERLQNIQQQMSDHGRNVDEQELRAVRETQNEVEEQKLDFLREHSSVLERKKEFLNAMLTTLEERLESGEPSAVPDPEKPLGKHHSGDKLSEHTSPIDRTNLSVADTVTSFSNRFIVHNGQIKWNNSLRDIILRYIHQVGQRRGFVYYMSRRAVKFILDIIEEQSKAKGTAPDKDDASQRVPSASRGSNEDEDSEVQDRIHQLLRDGKKFVDADDQEDAADSEKPSADNMAENLAREFIAQNTYIVHLIAPQIQLQSEKNSKSAVLLTAKSMQLKVIQIMDKDLVNDDVSGLVQRRFSAEMDNVQFFVTFQKNFSNDLFHMFFGNRYGAPAGSSWPPWVPMEVMFDFHVNPYGFTRVVQRTSASLRYDKYNTLRLKYNDNVSKAEAGRHPDKVENRIDHIWIDFPRIRAICDSSQYYAIYIIVLDLLLYSEPLEKHRSERLEKIMLASDFSDLRGAPEMVIMLQERIRQLEEIKLHFDIHEKYLDRQGWMDRISMDLDLASCEDELFFMMKAITTSQRRSEDRAHNTQTNGFLRWYMTSDEIVWHLIREKEEPLLEFQLQHAVYERTNNNDGSNLNSMEIGRFRGLNLMPDALYPEMIGPYFDETRSVAEGRNTKMLRVHWYMLEAIAGIPVMDHFEINLFPLKIQLEREVGKRLFEYIFPGAGAAAFESGTFSPFMIKNIHSPQEDEDDSGENEESPSTTRPQEARGSSGWKQGVGTGAGSLDARLTPTLTLPAHRPGSSSSGQKYASQQGSSHHFTLFHPSRPKSAPHHDGKYLGRRLPPSSDSLSTMSRTSETPSSTTLASVNGSKDDREKRKKHFGRRKPVTKEGEENKKRNGRSDDLTQMMSRASSYMTLAYVKIPSVVLCLSYKGKGHRNFEDVHNLVFRMPTLEYRNKTWSNLDLVLQLKKDVIRALISHTGAIIGNKLSHHRPNKAQQSRLRDLASHSQILASSQDLSRSTTGSESGNSQRELTPDGRSNGSMLSGTTDGAGLGITGGLQATLTAHRDFEHRHPSTGSEQGRGAGNALSRHLTGLTLKAREKEGIEGESEESTKRKSALLFGKKILHSLPHP